MLGAITLLALVGLPLLANNRQDSQRAGCFNNLRQIGRAIQIWGTDHQDYAPWHVPVTKGGTLPDISKPAVAWIEFLSFTNELRSPRVLACPADRDVRVAGNWGAGNNGIANSAFRGNAASYFISYHGVPDLPRSPMSGDHDFHDQGISLVCGPANAADVREVRVSTAAVWTNLLHATAGHVLTTDGAVEFVSSANLAPVLGRSQNGILHFVPPR